jgi:hypothetical protein
LCDETTDLCADAEMNFNELHQMINDMVDDVMNNVDGPLTNSIILVEGLIVGTTAANDFIDNLMDMCVM